MGIGRPTKYKEEYCQLLEDHMSEGFTFESFAGLVSVNFDTIHEWAKVHPSFSDAKKRGRAKQLMSNEQLLKDIAKGKVKNANVTAQIFIMKNCHQWKDRIEQVNIDISKEDTEKLKEEAKKLLEEF